MAGGPCHGMPWCGCAHASGGSNHAWQGDRARAIQRAQGGIRGVCMRIWKVLLSQRWQEGITVG